MAATVFTPYSTVESLLGAKPTWIPNALDVLRIQSYVTYEEIYWNVPDVFQITLRGSNELPLYVPSAKTIVDATNRYTAPGFTVSAAGTGADATVATTQLSAFLRRERFLSRFSGAKLYGIMRGDWIWHMTADATKPEGSRISLTPLDPGMYFPIPDDDDVDKITGCHLVELITDSDGSHIRRLTYRKVPQPGGTVRISVEDALFETDDWEGPASKPLRILTPVTMLDPRISSLPVYHIPNTDFPGDPFGSSEIRGMERLMAGLAQTLSDEDLALALDGIGVYATDGNQPVDPVTKKPTSWKLGPGRVVHTDGNFFNRVNGVTDLSENYGAHYDRIWDAIKQASATPDIAIGAVDVQIASSGVALQLQLGPMLAKAGDKSSIIVDVHNQMFYDWLTMWEPVYEGNDYEGVTVNCTTGSAVPVDRVQRFAELNDMLDRGVIDTGYYRAECVKLGYAFPSDIGPKADAEFAERNPSGGVAGAADPFADRLTQEQGNAQP